MLKAKLHALLFWQTRLGDIANQFYGLRIFYKNSFRTHHLKSKESAQAFLTKQYHIIEKGLALPAPRPGFGQPKIELLLDKSFYYIKHYGEDALIGTIRSCLHAYLEFNSKEGQDLNTDFYQRVQKFAMAQEKLSDLSGGTKKMIKSELRSHTQIPFEAFVRNRFSVRDFSSTPLEVEEIKKAIDIAKHAPSVCNRQAWKVHVFSDKNEMKRLLKLQGGNNGFTESIDKLLIITTNTMGFTTLESNQVFVDGGLFSMNLVLALHAMEIGSCCLNTCFPYTTEKKVKQIGGIPKHERVIMMMGIGNLKEEFEVALSKKKDLLDVAKIH